MNFKTVAQLVALALYLAAWWVKKAFGWDIQPSVLVAVGGLLTTFVMHAPPVKGVWGLRITKGLGVAFACVAVAFSVWPTQSAAVVKLSDQIAATELTTVPTQSVPNAEPIPATAAPATPIVAPEVVEDTSSASDIGVSGVLDASEPLTGVLKPGDAGTGVPAAGDATPR